MITSPLLPRFVIFLLFGLTGAWSVGAQDQRVELLLPDDGFHLDNFPPDPSAVFGSEIIVPAEKVDRGI